MEWSHRPSPESELESLNYSGPESEPEWSEAPGSECRREFDLKVGVGTTLIKTRFFLSIKLPLALEKKVFRFR